MIPVNFRRQRRFTKKRTAYFFIMAQKRQRAARKVNSPPGNEVREAEEGLSALIYLT